MPLAPGIRLGAYTIGAQLGVGGMGEVYRATDNNLGREVAVKVLPEALAQDGERLARFEREAKALASLNHPNIAIVHGFEKTGDVRALVMELVEGPTLAERIAQGPIAIDEAIPIARQIAEALEAAHEQGIVHRDLKPANVKIRDDGTVKVLDFGLAKIVEADPRVPSSLSMSPTITTPAMTQLGVILGTAAYMAPEQARGKPVDKRSDIWAFGCVLFEMLTGRRVFEGEDTTDTIAAVVRAEPKWDALPADVPASIRLLLTRCLEKDRKKRIGDISTALFIMNESSTLESAATLVTPVTTTAPRRWTWRSLGWSALAVVVASTVVAGSVWMTTRRDPPHVSRFEITTSGAWAIAQLNNPQLAITHDGSKVIYIGGPAGSGTSLFVRSIDRLEPTLIAERANFPFVSTDGEWVGFAAPATSLRKVPITGGPSLEIAKLDGALRGASWGADDTIVFATNGDTGLLRVSGAGGTPVVLTRPDKGTDHVRPRFLPGGRAVLFSITSASEVDRQIAVLDLRVPGAQPKVVIHGGDDARYLPSGHVVYVADNSLRAVRFDLDRLEAFGSPVPVLASLRTFGATGYVGDFDVTDDGTLVYLPASVAAGAEHALVWVDRHGKEESIPAPPRPYVYPRISPDGTRLALDVRDQESDIWVWDFVRGNAIRVTKQEGLDRAPVWAADGRSIFFSSARQGTPTIYRQRADGTGIAEPLTQSTVAQFPLSLSPDGTLLVFHEGPGGAVAADLMALSLDGKANVRALVKTPSGEENGVISPSGRWLAYQSNESGSWDIYVRQMIDLEHGARAIVSNAGGTQPRWSSDGRELFYISPRNEMMSVQAGNGETWSSGTPVKLFEVSSYFVGGTGSPFLNYDVAKDGRFLMLKPMSGGPTTDANTTTNIVVVQNWVEEVKRLLPR